MLVRQFQSIQNILKSKKDSLDKEIEVVSLMTGINEDELLKLPLNKIKDLFSKYSSSSVKVSTSINKYLFIKGRLYKGVTKIEDLAAGQYIDLKNFAKNDFNTNIHNMLAIIYKPVFGKYIHSEVAEAMKSAKIEKVYGLLFFYSNVLKRLSPTITICSVLAAQDIREIMKEIEKESLDL